MHLLLLLLQRVINRVCVRSPSLTLWLLYRQIWTFPFIMSIDITIITLYLFLGYSVSSTPGTKLWGRSSPALSVLWWRLEIKSWWLLWCLWLIKIPLILVALCSLIIVITHLVRVCFSYLCPVIF